MRKIDCAFAIVWTLCAIVWSRDVAAHGKFVFAGIYLVGIAVASCKFRAWHATLYGITTVMVAANVVGLNATDTRRLFRLILGLSVYTLACTPSQRRAVPRDD